LNSEVSEKKSGYSAFLRMLREDCRVEFCAQLQPEGDATLTVATRQPLFDSGSVFRGHRLSNGVVLGDSAGARLNQRSKYHNQLAVFSRTPVSVAVRNTVQFFFAPYFFIRRSRDAHAARCQERRLHASATRVLWVGASGWLSTSTSTSRRSESKSKCDCTA